MTPIFLTAVAIVAGGLALHVWVIVRRLQDIHELRDRIHETIAELELELIDRELRGTDVTE